MPVTLEIRSGPSAGKQVFLGPGQSLCVGRGEHADVRIASDNHLAREHFLLRVLGGECRLRDLNSAGGTLLNGTRVSGAVVRDGDIIIAGTTHFLIHVKEASESQAAATGPTAVPGAPAAPGAAVEGPPPLLQMVNATSFPASILLWNDLEDHPRLTVIVKITLTFAQGEVAQIADDQLPIFTSDIPNSEEDAPNASVRFESDMVPFKPRADVVLVGKAHAPGGKPVPQVDVRLRVGKLDRRLRVFGDRTWRFATKFSLIPAITPPEPFVTMDLVYERAFGGIDGDSALYCKENLIGVGFIGKIAYQTVHETALPNLEDPQDLITSPKTRPKPVGFGFYGRGWMPRLAYAGTYDDRYRAERSPRLPLDRSYALNNGAHPDLQVDGYLRGNETIEMENLGERPCVVFRLPGIAPQVAVSKWKVPLQQWLSERPGSEPADFAAQVPRAAEKMAMVLDTLVLIPEEDRLYLVFRGATALTDLDATEIAQILISP